MAPPPLPPPSDLGLGVADETPSRSYTWTPAQIEAAACELYDLAEVYQKSEKAKKYPLEDVMLRLCVRWAGHEIPFDTALYPLDATPESIAKNWGCSPPDATVKEGGYILQVVGRGSKVGGVMDVLSHANEGAFVIAPEDAPVMPWSFIASRRVSASLKKYVEERAAQAGQWLAEPRQDGDGSMGGMFHDREPPYRPHNAPQFDDVRDPRGGYQPPMQPTAPYPGSPVPGTTPARGPNGEDVYVAQYNLWVNSPARQAELQQEAERKAELRAAQEKLDALQKQIERQEAERKAEREAAEKQRAKEEAERKAADEREAFKREMLEMQRRADERFEKAMQAMQRPAEAPKTTLPEIVTAVGSALAPILGVLKDGRDREREESQARAAAEKEARAAAEARAEAEAGRRHERELAELKAREEREREERKRDREFQAQLLNRGPSVDPNVIAMQAELKALAKAVEKAADRDRRENTSDSRSSFEVEVARFKSLAKLMGYDKDDVIDAVPEETTGAILKQAGEVVAPIVEHGMKFIGNRLATSDAREARREDREEARHLREEMKAKPRNPSFLETPDGNLVPMERARFANGTEVEIPPDHVMLNDGSACIPLTTFPAFVARRTAAHEAQRQMVLQGAGQQPTNYLPPPALEQPMVPDPMAPAPMPFETNPAPVGPVATAPGSPTLTPQTSRASAQLPLALTTEARPAASLEAARDRLARLKPARYVAPTTTSVPATSNDVSSFNEST